MYIYNTSLLSYHQGYQSLPPPTNPGASEEAATMFIFFSVPTHILKPIRSTILLKQEPLSIRKPPRNAPFTFWGLRTVEVGYVLVSYISEPVFWSISSIPTSCVCVCAMTQRIGTYQWILLLSSNSPKAILCTGASPHRS